MFKLRKINSEKKILILQVPSLKPDQINLAVFFCFHVKSDCSVRYCTIAYTGQVTFYKVPEI